VNVGRSLNSHMPRSLPVRGLAAKRRSMKLKLEDLKEGTILTWQGSKVWTVIITKVVNESWCQGAYCTDGRFVSPKSHEHWRPRKDWETFDYLSVEHPGED